MNKKKKEYSEPVGLLSEVIFFELFKEGCQKFKEGDEEGAMEYFMAADEIANYLQGIIEIEKGNKK